MQTNIGDEVVGVVAKNSTDYVTQVFSILARGQTAVTLRSASDKERIELVGVGDISEPDDGSGWVDDLAYPAASSSEKHIAQVLFTSGTEGASKAILLSAAALQNTTERLISVMEITSDIREYVGVPVHYSFGFGRCRVVSQVGGAFYIPPNGFDLSEIVEMLERGEINAISAVPTLWRLLLQCPELFSDIGKKLRWIEIGSQYMSRSEKEQLKSLFPNARIVQHYGLTEASRSTFLKIHEVEGEHLESVGKATDGVEASIGKDGLIRLRGPHLASGVIAEAGRRSLVNEESWFVTSDAGSIKDGFLYFGGRSDDVINCGGIKLSPDVIEQALFRELGIGKGVAVSKMTDDMRGEVPIVGYLSESNIDADKLLAVVTKVLRKSGLAAGNIVRVFECTDFPLTQTGKLQRKELTKKYLHLQPSEGTEVQAQTAATAGESDATQKLVAIWQEVLKISPISVHDSFFDLGGDSLSAISVIMKMQKSGIPQETCRKIFEGKSISEIVKEQSVTAISEEKNAAKATPIQGLKTPLAAASESLNIVRGILVLLNVAAHWMPGVISRLPGVFYEINKYFATLYSSGTPGFAVVYGAGVGFFFLPRFRKEPSSVKSVLKRNILLLGCGIFCLSTVRVISALIVGEELTVISYSNSFWSVLTFYFYAVLSLYIWLKILTRWGDFSFACLSMAAVFYLIQLRLDSQSIPPSSNPVVQHFVLLLTTKYSYFDMSAGVLIGAAAGNWIRQAILSGRSLKPFAISGLLLIGFAVIVSYEMGEMSLWTTWPKGLSLWTWLLYLGFVLIGIVTVKHYFTSRILSGPTSVASKTLAIVGILAFPIFIAHELVIPVKDMLIELGVPFALPITLAAFFVGIGYFVHRLYVAYYGKSTWSLGGKAL